jgi:hypothetical protein
VTGAIGMAAVAWIVNWTVVVQVHLYCALHVYVDFVHLCCKNAGHNGGTQGGDVVYQA